MKFEETVWNFEIYFVYRKQSLRLRINFGDTLLALTEVGYADDKQTFQAQTRQVLINMAQIDFYLECRWEYENVITYFSPVLEVWVWSNRIM